MKEESLMHPILIKCSLLVIGPIETTRVKLGKDLLMTIY